MSGDGFFSDKKLQAFVASVPFSAFVETGTCEGDTTRWMAQRCAHVFTCDIDDFTEIFKKSLPNNVQFYAMNSPDFLIAIRRDVGDSPLFFLDAHWRTYWPLLDELRAIASLYDTAVIIVHDCTVPGRPNFWSCRGGGGENDGPINDWNYIKQGLSTGNRYRLFYPTYGDNTPGWLVLFQNVAPMGDLSNLKEAAT